MASTFADLLRQRLAQGGAQSVPQPSQGYGGSTPGAVPVTPDQARVEAAQRVAAALLNAKLRQVQSGGGAATPQSQMTQPQLQAAGPAYGSQAARVAAAPSVQAQPGIVPDIRKDTYGGLADLQAQQSAATYTAPPTPPYTPGFSTTPVVPQAQDIRLLESNSQLPSGTLPLTPEQQDEEKAAVAQAQIAQVNTLIDTPGSQEQIAYQRYIDGGWSDQEAREIVIKNFQTGIAGNQSFFSGITGFMNIFDMPRQAVVTEMGNGALRVANGQSDSWDPGWGAVAPINWGIPGLDSTRLSQDFQRWAEDPANAAIIRNAGENGFQADMNSPRYTGGQAVWELFINSAGMAYKVFADALADPTILFGAGKAGGEKLVTSSLADAAEGKGLQAAVKYGAGNVFSAPQRVLDATIELPFNAAGKVISVAGQEILPTDGVIMRNVKGAFQSLFSPTDRQIATDQRELIEGSLEYGERVYGGYEPTTGPGGPGSSGTPNGKPQQPTNPGGAPTSGTTYQKPGEYGYRLDTTNDGWKTWAILNPDGSVYSDGHKWSPPTGPEKNFLENEVRRVVANLNRPAEVAQMQSAGIVVPPDSWDWADPTRFRFTSWGNDQTSRDLPFRMTHDLRIPQETRQAMVDELTPAVEAHVQVMNDIDANVVSQLKKKLPEGAGEAAKQAGHDIAVPIKTMEMLRFYAEDVFPVWQNHMGAIDESAYVFRYGDTPNPKDVNSLLEHALFGTRDTVTMIEKNGKMVPQVDASGTASQSRRALREMGGKIEGVPATDVARNISEQRAKLFGEESLSQNASAAKSRATRARAAAVPQEVKVEAAATDMGAGRVPQVIDADTMTLTPMIDPVTVIPAKKAGAKPTAQLNLRADDASLRSAINDPDKLTKTPAGLRIRKDGGFTTVWSSSRKDPLDVTARILDTGKKHIVTTGSGQPIGDASSLGEAIAMADDFLLGKIGSPADVKASKTAATETITKQTPGGNTLDQQVIPGDTTGFLNAFSSSPEIVGGQFEVRQNGIGGPWEVRRVGDDAVIASFPQQEPVTRNGKVIQQGREQAIAKADELLAGGSTPTDVKAAKRAAVQDVVATRSPMESFELAAQSIADGIQASKNYALSGANVGQTPDGNKITQYASSWGDGRRYAVETPNGVYRVNAVPGEFPKFSVRYGNLDDVKFTGTLDESYRFIDQVAKPDAPLGSEQTLAELDAEIAAYEAIPTFESKVGTRTSTTAYEKRTTLKAMKERRAKLESSLGIVPPVESPFDPDQLLRDARQPPMFRARIVSLEGMTPEELSDLVRANADVPESTVIAETDDGVVNVSVQQDPPSLVVHAESEPDVVIPLGESVEVAAEKAVRVAKRKAAVRRPEQPLDVSGNDKSIRNQILDTKNRWRTPGGNKIEPIYTGKTKELWVSPVRAKDGDGIRLTYDRPYGDSDFVWVVGNDSGDLSAQRQTLAEAIAEADVRIAQRSGKMNLGIVPPVESPLVDTPTVQAAGSPTKYAGPGRLLSNGTFKIKGKGRDAGTIIVKKSGDSYLLKQGEKGFEARIPRSLVKGTSKERVPMAIADAIMRSENTPADEFASMSRVGEEYARAIDEFELATTGKRILSTQFGIVHPSVRQSMEMDRNFSRLIQEREGAVTGLGLDDVLANRDSSPIGIALRLGVIDQETYAGLSRIVTWGQRYMPLYSAYEQLRDSGMAHREAVDTLMRVLAPFPEMKAAPTWLAKWWRRVLAGPDSWYMTTLTAMRQQQQYNLANGAAKAIADQIGNSYTLLVTGAPTDALKVWTNPRTYANFIRIERGDKARLATLNHMDRMDTLGVRPRHGVLELNAGRTEAADGSEMILREKGKGTPIGDSKIVGAAYGVLANKAIKDIRNAGDRNARYTHYMGRFFREVKKGRAKFYNLVRNRAEALGQDADEWVRLVKGLGDDFSNDDILRVLGDERLARDWREILGQADRTAYRSVNEKMFSYRQMKIDEKLRYVVFYHYWMSRAFLLHSKTAMKNPWLMNAYLNTWQGLQNEAEEKGYPPSVVGTLRFLTSTEGFQSYMNPIGVTVPFDILIDQGNTDPSVADWLRSHGLFFNPIVDAALGVMGMTSRVSDLTQTKAVRRGIKAYVNWMNSNGYENAIPDQIAGPNELVQDPIDIIQQRITQKANDWWSSGPGMEGWAQEFTQPDGYELDLVSSILMTQMEEALGPNSGWSDAEWDQYLEAQEAIMLHRDGNEYADAAVEAFSDANAEVALISAIAPGGLQPRYAPRDEDMALRDEGNQDARDRRTLATSGSPDDTALTVGINRLEDIGTESGRNAYSAWNEIANLEELPLSAIGTFIEIDGEQIYAGDIANMSYDQRAELADRWVSQYGATEDLASYREERDLYLMKHPEVGDFKEFQKGVYGFDGGPRAWREQYAKTDDDFRAAMEEKEARLRETHTQQEIIDRELDQWAASQEAYKVANGVRDNSYDAPVEPKVPDYGFAEKDAPGASGGSTGSSETKTPIEKTRTTITSYNDKIAKAVAVMNASGYSVTADDLIYANDYYKQAWGLFDIPSMPYDANLYWQWVLLQPSGADTSVDAYLKVLEASGYSVAA